MGAMEHDALNKLIFALPPVGADALRQGPSGGAVHRESMFFAATQPLASLPSLLKLTQWVI